jgi:hypothetical protein
LQHFFSSDWSLNLNQEVVLIVNTSQEYFMLKAVFDWFKSPSPKAFAPAVQPEAAPYKVNAVVVAPVTEAAKVAVPPAKPPIVQRAPAKKQQFVKKPVAAITAAKKPVAKAPAAKKPAAKKPSN